MIEAWTKRTVATWDEWTFGPWRIFKTNFDGPWNLADSKGVIFTDPMLQVVMAEADRRSKDQ